MSAPPLGPPPPLGRLGSLASLSSLWPTNPSRWTKAFENRIINRLVKRLNVLDERINAVVKGRTVPDLDEVNIGSGSQCNLAVLFLDICGFSTLPNWLPAEQKHVLALMNLFMAEMITIVREFGGHFEKNTGDGLMAYFGEGEKTDADRVKPAVEAAMVMHYFNDQVLGPLLESKSLSRVSVRPTHPPAITSGWQPTGQA